MQRELPNLRVPYSLNPWPFLWSRKAELPSFADEFSRSDHCLPAYFQSHAVQTISAVLWWECVYGKGRRYGVSRMCPFLTSKLLAGYLFCQPWFSLQFRFPAAPGAVLSAGAEMTPVLLTILSTRTRHTAQSQLGQSWLQNPGQAWAGWRIFTAGGVHLQSLQVLLGRASLRACVVVFRVFFLFSLWRMLVAI